MEEPFEPGQRRVDGGLSMTGAAAWPVEACTVAGVAGCGDATVYASGGAAVYASGAAAAARSGTAIPAGKCRVSRGVCESRFGRVRRILRRVACDVGVGGPLVRVVATPVVDLARPRIAARFSGASLRTCSNSSRASSNRPTSSSARPSVTCAEKYAGWRTRPAVQAAIASSKRPARRYSSASAANAMDAGSDWTRRLSSSIRRRVRHRQRLFYDGSLRPQSGIRERDLDVFRSHTRFPGLVGDDERDLERPQEPITSRLARARRRSSVHARPVTEVPGVVDDAMAGGGRRRGRVERDWLVRGRVRRRNRERRGGPCSLAEDDDMARLRGSPEPVRDRQSERCTSRPWCRYA